ncbi:DUF1972 domain-containing protein [Mucilaginibacter glaciei]|uniref:DUF1972 domain-containing protein n=1 Tax=Mucilaginibacter glaciei TaxID=2772109 RepID=A0A926S3N5_9SPHI|nr:DUF1972 domain-containing protein [Mucilaginibacter glaciei]MBD1395408.1 DUF1972 domain-containing protein [Mucilaginibacter glaciei]
MRIAIIGTRGIPNHYGGFEQCAEYLAEGLVKKGYDVVVYNSHNHPYQNSEWRSVKICHCYDPENKIGTAGQFIYDLNCILDLKRKDFDVILQLGYTSSSVWNWLLPRNAVVTTNMDGLEWTRSKYSKPVQRFLKLAEKLAAVKSDHLIADSLQIQTYLKDKYGREATYIPYGAELFDDNDTSVLDEYKLRPFNYDMLIARMEPENSLEVILEGVAKANLDRPFLVIGCAKTKYAKYLKSKFGHCKQIRFYNGIYDMDKLNNLRYHANLYFHGHTVGGTNPSLLESMASNSLICSHKNKFNCDVLGDDALYFSTPADVSGHLQTAKKSTGQYATMMANNRQKIKDVYSRENIVNAYANHFEAIVSQARKAKQYVAIPNQKEISFQLKNS